MPRGPVALPEEVVEETGDTIVIDRAMFEELLNSNIENYETLGNNIAIMQEILGVEEVPGEEAPAGGGDINLDVLDLDQLLDLADEYKLIVPRTLRTEDQIRDFLGAELPAVIEAIIAAEEAGEVIEEVVEEVPPPPAPRRTRTPAAPPAPAPSRRVAPAPLAPAPSRRGAPAPAPSRRGAPAPSPEVVRGKLKAAVRGRAR